MRPGSPAATARRPYDELERKYRKEVAEHKVTNEVLNIVRVIALVLLALLIGGVSPLVVRAEVGAAPLAETLEKRRV